MLKVARIAARHDHRDYSVLSYLAVREKGASVTPDCSEQISSRSSG